MQSKAWKRRHPSVNDDDDDEEVNRNPKKAKKTKVLTPFDTFVAEIRSLLARWKLSEGFHALQMGIQNQKASTMETFPAMYRLLQTLILRRHQNYHRLVGKWTNADGSINVDADQQIQDARKTPEKPLPDDHQAIAETMKPIANLVAMLESYACRNLMGYWGLVRHHFYDHQKDVLIHKGNVIALWFSSVQCRAPVRGEDDLTDLDVVGTTSHQGFTTYGGPNMLALRYHGPIRRFLGLNWNVRGWLRQLRHASFLSGLYKNAMPRFLADMCHVLQSWDNGDPDKRMHMAFRFRGIKHLGAFLECLKDVLTDCRHQLSKVELLFLMKTWLNRYDGQLPLEFVHTVGRWLPGMIPEVARMCRQEIIYSDPVGIEVNATTLLTWQASIRLDRAKICGYLRSILGIGGKHAALDDVIGAYTGNLVPLIFPSGTATGKFQTKDRLRHEPSYNTAWTGKRDEISLLQSPAFVSKAFQAWPEIQWCTAGKTHDAILELLRA